MVGEFLGPYRLLETLEAGGLSVILRARDEAGRRDVVLKALLQGPLADDASRDALRREAETLRRLAHPGIVACHDLGVDGDIDFLVLEYVPGESLAAILAARGPLPEGQVVDLGRQLADALGAVHAAGFVHRDVKPGNVLVTPAGAAKLVDFGQALPAGESPPDNPAAAGTLAYMAPEQLRRDSVDPRTDLWALGALLYETATGRRPFVGATADQVVDAILHREPPRPSELRPGLSPAFDRLTSRTLEKKPKKRHPTAQSLAAALHRLPAEG
jgi:serine/threonine protein kinase